MELAEAARDTLIGLRPSVVGVRWERVRVFVAVHGQGPTSVDGVDRSLERRTGSDPDERDLLGVYVVRPASLNLSA